MNPDAIIWPVFLNLAERPRIALIFVIVDAAGRIFDLAGRE
jgi:hypothetical protein